MSSSPSLSAKEEGLPSPASIGTPFPYLSISRPKVVENTGAPVESMEKPISVSSDEAGATEQRARRQGHEEALAEARKSFEAAVQKEREILVEAISRFQRDRALYFQQVESQVVQLALSIARKILHREAQIDPLMLAGIVRVTLERIEGVSRISLRVNPQNGAEWRKYLTMHLQPAEVPEIIEDPEQPADRCALETSMGSTVVGVDVQLQEIEKGLLDLIAARPGNSQ